MFVAGNRKLCDDVCRLLGLDPHRVISLQLNIDFKDAVTLTVKEHATIAEGQVLEEVFSQYKIEATQIKPQQGPC